MRYGSVCSGIEAATVAWDHLGWEPAFFSEIEAFPRAVLAHHYPEAPLHGDFTTIGENEYGSIQLLVGGTPCQSFSVAGLRGGLDDDRGNLALEFLRLAQRERPRWLVWENVPGVLSSNGGRDFGSILGGLVELGYGFAYRVLDAQYFGVAQRRKRVFVVGYLGDWRPAAAVFFERESLSGNPAPRRKAGQVAAPDVAKSIRGNSGGIDREDMHTLIPALPVMASGAANAEITENMSPTLTTLHDGPPIAFNWQDNHAFRASDSAANPLRANQTEAIANNLQVRRLTPVECERLQGFPDNYTRIPWRNKTPEQCPDGPRYKALGNSMAVPVMRWIGERIDQVDKIMAGEKAIEILAEMNCPPKEGGLYNNQGNKGANF